MQIEYKDKKIEKLCNDQKAMQKFFSNGVLVKKMMELMTFLRNAEHLKEFAVLPVLRKYRYHELTNDMKGIHSLSLDYSYRMTLTLEIIGEDDEVDTIKILEVSNHYGD